MTKMGNSQTPVRQVSLLCLTWDAGQGCQIHVEVSIQDFARPLPCLRSSSTRFQCEMVQGLLGRFVRLQHFFPWLVTGTVEFNCGFELGQMSLSRGCSSSKIKALSYY